MKILTCCLILVALCQFDVFSDSSEETQAGDGLRPNRPFWLSLLLSHGTGFYAINQPQKAKPYLLSNIFFVDLPLLILGSAVLLHKVNPALFQGPLLAVAEYVTNACLLSAIVAVPVLHLLECWAIWKAQNRS